MRKIANPSKSPPLRGLFMSGTVSFVTSWCAGVLCEMLSIARYSILTNFFESSVENFFLFLFNVFVMCCAIKIHQSFVSDRRNS